VGRRLSSVVWHVLPGTRSLRRRTDAGGDFCGDADAVVIARLCRSGHEHFRRPHREGGGDGHRRGVGEGVWGCHGASSKRRRRVSVWGSSIFGSCDRAVVRSGGRAVGRSCGRVVVWSCGRAVGRSCGRVVGRSCGRVVVLSHSRNRNNAQSLRTYVDQTKGFALATFGSIQGVYLAKKLLESGAWFVGWFGWGEDTLAVCVGRPWVG